MFMALLSRLMMICRLIDAVAEDHAIEDLFYELDKMLENGQIKLDDFLKV